MSETLFAFPIVKRFEISSADSDGYHIGLPPSGFKNCSRCAMNGFIMRSSVFGFSKFTVTSDFTLEEHRLGTSSVRVLVVDDFEPYRCLVASVLREKPELQILCEVSDGLEAVQKAKELQPNLILLDIELPNLNGIQVASCIRQVSPRAKIIFLTQNRDEDVVAAALTAGGHGYVLKTDAGSELLNAVNAVLRDGEFISSGINRNQSRETENV